MIDHVINPISIAMKRIFSIIFFGLSLLILSSCTKDIEDGLTHRTDDPNGNSILLALTVATGDTTRNIPLRSTDNGEILRGVGIEDGDKYKDIYKPKLLNENKIETLSVFIFDSSDSLILSYANDRVKRVTTTSTTDGTYTVRLDVPYASISRVENKLVKLIVVANATGDIISGVSTLSQLRSKVESYDDLNQSEQPRAKFLMDGYKEVTTINWPNGKLVYDLKSTPIELKRALAKIRLRISDIKIKDFQNGSETIYNIVKTADGKDDISIKLVKYKKSTSLLAGFRQNNAETIQETSYRMMAERTFAVNPSPNGDGKFRAAFPFYATESQWESRSKEETHLMLRIRLIPQNPREDDKDGQYYYYRIPINYRKVMDDVPAERLNKVERNYLYDIVTKIEQLGSIDEGTPLDVESYIAIQPWPANPDQVDGSIVKAHYLVVKEREPIMANIDSYTVEYLSDLPVTVKVTKAYYEFYDLRGDYYKVVFDENGYYKFYEDPEETRALTDSEITNKGLLRPEVKPKFNKTSVTWTEDKYIKDGTITMTHPIPVNYVPFKFELEVVQIRDASTTTPLTETVLVTQYPPIFVTGEKSPGLGGGTSQVQNDYGEFVDVFADFRFHTTYGAPSVYQNSNFYEAQRNNVFNRVSVKVPSGNYFIGNPVGADGYTKRDQVSNRLVSPEFIIASQFGMTNRDTPQTSKDDRQLSKIHNNSTTFYEGYGPYRTSLFPIRSPYAQFNPSRMFDKTMKVYFHNLPTYRYYSNAEERCHLYFEGEYGRDGEYEEHYVSGYNTGGYPIWKTRTVKKTFKYKGSWRVPTLEEVKLIDGIQDDPNSVTKSLMFGDMYWTAESDVAFKMTENVLVSPTGAPVRCVFDTYMHDDKK
ncbi:hypothetical protein IX315_001788 [Porphyromonas levii]|nr:hypothetical protein [Porphyromonas levii]